MLNYKDTSFIHHSEDIFIYSDDTWQFVKQEQRQSKIPYRSWKKLIILLVGCTWHDMGA